MAKTLDKVDDLREFFDELKTDKKRVEEERTRYAEQRTSKPSIIFPYGSHQSAKEGC